MRSHVSRRLVYAAGVVSLLAMGAAAAPSAVAAPDRVAVPGPPVAGTSPVLLITGMRFGFGPDGRAPVLLPGRSQSAMPITGLRAAGRSCEVPVDALPFLGHGLDPSLFDLAALRRLEQGGRLPVQVSYQGQVPVLPGIRITSAAAGTARGYLTAASAVKFGAALRAQYAADHDRASYGTDGLFAHGVSIALAGAAEAPPVRPQFQMHTLTVHGTDLAGKPDNGDSVVVVNADDSNRFGDLFEVEAFFEHGVAKFSVPKGHYWVIGEFVKGIFAKAPDLRDVILPQVSVFHDKAQVNVDERAATSKLQVSTPRPAVPALVTSTVVRTPGQPGGASSALLNILPPGWSLWMNPTHKKPTVGGLESFTQFQLASRISRPGVPYAYDLDFEGPAGLVPSQHFTARPSSLAVIDNRYFQDFRSVGGWTMSGGTRDEVDGGFIVLSGSVPIRLPGHLIEYVTARPGVVWSQTYFQFVDVTPGFPVAAGGQSNAFRSFRPGQRVIENWNDYPLHPQPAVSQGRLAGGLFGGVIPAAARIGDTLALDPVVFSDSTVGHLGAGFLDGAGFDTLAVRTVSGRFLIEQNGKRLASGNAANGLPRVKLSKHPSIVRFTLTARRTDPRYDLSTASDTTWTWRSRPDASAKVPAPWGCLPNGGFNGTLIHQCAVQPMMTLNYQVAGLRLDGSTAPGKQVIHLRVGHLQLAGDPAISRATVRVSFNGGKTWQAAKVTKAGQPGRFTVTFAAPAKALVTLRATAADRAGGSVFETITSAYKTS